MEVIYNPMSSGGSILSLPKHSFDSRRSSSDSINISFRCRNPMFGAEQYHWLLMGQDNCLSKVWVAADYPDSVPDSSNHTGSRGYHPLEEIKVNERKRETLPTPAEIARTTAEASCSALLVFPGAVHSEPHQHISWSEFQYLIDDNGDMFFEIYDDENTMRDHEAINPVNVLIGMDIPMQVNTEKSILDTGNTDDISYYGFGPRHFRHSSGLGKVKSLSSDSSNLFCKLLDKEEPESEGEQQIAAAYILTDGEPLNFNSMYHGSNFSSTLYKLEIVRMELFSVYGAQCLISLQDFQDAEPDVLVHRASEIIKHFSDKGMTCNIALKALCRKKGSSVEGAHLIGVDSLSCSCRD